jgi:hypothetical protein
VDDNEYIVMPTPSGDEGDISLLIDEPIVRDSMEDMFVASNDTAVR